MFKHFRLKILSILFVLAFEVFAGQKAVTDTGDLVILNDDGTWMYENTAKSGQGPAKVLTNETRFKKPEDSVFQLKSKNTNMGLWMNPKKWGFAKKKSINADAEFEFKHKNLDIYGIVITETIEIELTHLTKLAFENIESVGENVMLVTEEYRVVNGTKVAFLEIKAKVTGMHASYYGYYYSDNNGSNQVLVFSGANTAKKHESEIFDLLNGFVVR